MPIRYLFLALALSGCNSTASQILGSGAIPISPDKDQRIKVPGVYRITKDGKLLSVCQKDFELQNKLKKIKVTREEFSDTFEDSSFIDGAEFSAFGITFVPPKYKSVKIEGGTKSVAEIEDEDFYDYVYKNVGKTCRSKIDRQDVIIVEKEAKGKKTYLIYKLPIKNDIKFGPGTIKPPTEKVNRAPSNVTIGIVGR